MFKRNPKSKKEKIQVVKITTEEWEHECTEKCLKTKRESKPKGLRRVNLGFVFHDDEGRCYSQAGGNGWLEVTGITFAIGHGGLGIIFQPKHQLHIHSPNDRTTKRTTMQRIARVGPEFHAEVAAKKLQQKGNNRKEAQTFFLSEIQKVIPKAPKHKKPIKGTGRGGPGAPRTELGTEVVRLIGTGISKREVLSPTIAWAKNNSVNIAGSHKNRIKKQVDRWWNKTNPTHK